MTESEWLKQTHVRSLLLHLRLKTRPSTSARKLRLFGCACLRHVGHFLGDERLETVIAGVEDYADDPDSSEPLSKARSAALGLKRMLEQRDERLGQARTAGWVWHTANMYDMMRFLDPLRPADRRAFLVVLAARALTRSSARGPGLGIDAKVCGKMARWASECCQQAAKAAEARYQVAVLRDIFGNPFQQVDIEPGWLKWRDRTVVNLARAAYETRALPAGHLEKHRLLVLADSLEESGCTDGRILGHLRQNGPHVRGCWCLDLLLRRS